MRNNPTNNPSASTPERSRSSLPARRAEPRSRRSRAIKPFIAPLAALLASFALLPVAASAATPSPSPHAAGSKPPLRVDVTKVQPKALLPKHAEHSEYIVGINKLGQVTTIKAGRGSDNATFNAQTYGNALQAFIRTPDGLVVLGTYRLTYDYDPKTERVRRDVTLLHQGGVNPDAKGAAVVLMEKAQAQSHKAAATVDPRSLPDLKSITPPTPEPKPS